MKKVAAVSNKRPGRQDDELIKSAWDWAAEASETHEVGVRVSLTPTARRGVWRVRIQACDLVGDKVVCIKKEQVIEFPGSSHQTLAGAIMAGLLRLDNDLSQGDLLAQRPM